MVTGLLRPDAGSVTVLDHDVWADPTAAKRSLGVLPDRLRLFDRLTGAQLLYYSATLRGLDGPTARERSADLAEAFGLGDALGRQVADYSVGMAKKIALAATLIHSPRVLVLDEPFESVDPVSAATITDILRRYTRGGGTVVLSSHSMELVQRTCDSVAVIVGGKVLASGTMAQVRGRKSLEDKFVELAGGRVVAESMEWFAQLLRLRADLLAGEVRGGARRSVLVVLGSLAGLLVAVAIAGAFVDLRGAARRWRVRSWCPSGPSSRSRSRSCRSSSAGATSSTRVASPCSASAGATSRSASVWPGSSVCRSSRWRSSPWGTSPPGPGPPASACSRSSRRSSPSRRARCSSGSAARSGQP